MNGEVTYRSMTAEDTRVIPEIEKVCGLHPWTEEGYIYEGANPLARYLVAEAGGRMIGFAGIWCVVDEAQLMKIGVLPECQGQGVGHALMDQLITLSQREGCISMTLEVRVNNEKALSFYGGLGFYVTGRREKYYDDGTDAFLMQKDYEA